MSKSYGPWFCMLAIASTLGCGAAKKSMEAETQKVSAVMESEAEAELERAEVEVRAAGDEIVDPIAVAVANPTRTPEEVARDLHRHPYETLSFFEVKPTDTVVELWSGGGWYTHILAPLIAGRGKLYVTAYAPDAEPTYRAEMTQKLNDYLQTQQYDEEVSVVTIAEPFELGLENEADVVLTFRNVHNWVKGGFDDKVYAQAFRALKPGGVFGVVEHRAPEGTSREVSAETGYMDQARVIADIEAAGFEFVEASEVNANPRDTKDHPEGVWTLPPSLRLGETDREKYTVIGESDRMTLKFIKPTAI